MLLIVPLPLPEHQERLSQLDPIAIVERLRIADDDAIACALAAHALERAQAPLFVDLADSKVELRRLLDARGFTAVRPFTRMIYGSSTRFDDAARTFAVIGPEFG